MIDALEPAVVGLLNDPICGCPTSGFLLLAERFGVGVVESCGLHTRVDDRQDMDRRVGHAG